MTSPFTLPYTSTKFALNGFFGSLNHELAMKKSNVSISICTLGLIDTESAMEKVRFVKYVTILYCVHKGLLGKTSVVLELMSTVTCRVFPYLRGVTKYTSLSCHRRCFKHRHCRSNKTAGPLLLFVHICCDRNQRDVSFDNKLHHSELLQLCSIKKICDRSAVILCWLLEGYCSFFIHLQVKNDTMIADCYTSRKLQKNNRT